MRITPSNIANFPVGTEVHFNYGVFGGTENAKVVGHGSDRFYPAYLIAETASGEQKTIMSFTTVGIGSYLGADPFATGPIETSEDEISMWVD